jgi:hypothetical protein
MLRPQWVLVLQASEVIWDAQDVIVLVRQRCELVIEA